MKRVTFLLVGLSVIATACATREPLPPGVDPVDATHTVQARNRAATEATTAWVPGRL